MCDKKRNEKFITSIPTNITISTWSYQYVKNVNMELIIWDSCRIIQ